LFRKDVDGHLREQFSEAWRWQNNVSIWSDKWIHNRICDVIDIEKTSIYLVQYIVADFIKDGEFMMQYDYGYIFLLILLSILGFWIVPNR
jgi:hypothetical protein